MRSDVFYTSSPVGVVHHIKVPYTPFIIRWFGGVRIIRRYAIFSVYHFAVGKYKWNQVSGWYTI